MLGALAMSASPVFAADHCEDHEGNAGKINSGEYSYSVDGVDISWSGDPGSITLENTNDVETATVVWCAKGGADFAGPGDMATTTQTTTLLPGETETFGPFGTQVSYFLLYSVTLTTPTPTPTPTPTQGSGEAADTEVLKSASADAVTRGDSYTYTLSVTNIGDGVAENVHVWDDLDKDLTVTSVTPSQGTCDPVGPSNEVDCWLGDLAAGASATVLIEVDTDDADCETVHNRASVRAENEELPSSSARVDVTIACDDDASLNILKVDEEGDPLAGAVFTVDGLPGTYTTGADGKACILGLLEDSEWVVTEIQAPAGYEIADPAWQLVDVDNDGDCNSPDAVFVNAEAEGTQSPSPSGSVAPTASASPSQSASPSGSAAPTGSASASAAPTQSVNPAATATPMPTASPVGGQLAGTPTTSPRGAVLGSTLPDTAAAETDAGSSAMAWLLASLMLGGLGVLGTRAAAEARRRR